MSKVFMMDGTPLEVANIFCIGRNYAEHIKELGNRAEDEPVVFLKPLSALSPEGEPIHLPAWSNDVHYEAELVMLIGKGGKHIPMERALDHVAAYGLGLDLTARDRQNQAKTAGLPWLLSKGFDQSACVSRFIPAMDLPTPQHCRFSLEVNGLLRQLGRTEHMLFTLAELIAYLSRMFTLSPGDLIFTGTPEGVGKLSSGDSLRLCLSDKLEASFTVLGTMGAKE
ncbi:fumarylacetoacetate hydrolase family protein [Chromobacterium vaccinii]|uniref:fumarylacetoacetate hydrolase family protein n=1 Tax=Chromobacterium vaccinii TaxID=1108595 RepID=UPI001E4AD08E|nr:fumarylacetoacetate hydrolase family protein [Chromobacterium vaccinii]MCD4484942.1 fumarylacetoacetate hydrolase family protein [Chromobacterium vaccinii]